MSNSKLKKLLAKPVGKQRAKAAAVSSPAEKIRAVRAARATESAKLVRKCGTAETPATESAPQAPAVEPVAQVAAATEAPQAPKANGQHELAEPQVLSIPLKYLKAALSVAPKDDVRFYLNGVNIHQMADGQMRIVATDGHRLLAIKLETTEPVQWAQGNGVILPVGDLARIVKYLGKGGELNVAYGENHPRAVLTGTGDNGTFSVKPIDGKFPDYQRVVDAGAVAFTSEREDMETSNIDGKYLKSAAVVASELGAKGVMPFIGGDSNAAVVFTFAQVPEALLYIMPMKQPTACLPAPTVNFYSPQAMRDTVTMLRDRAKKARQRATTSKDKTYVEFTLKRAARLEGKADSLAATLSVKIEGPKVDAQAPTAATEQPQG